MTTAPSSVELRLVGGPYVVLDGHRAEIPDGGKRLLVYVALRGRRVERRRVAGALWPVGDDARAAGNLRSALWRLRGAGLHLLHGDHGSLTLSEQVVVDVEQISEWAARIVAGQPTAADLVMRSGWLDALDLLPGWYDDWALMERERLRQRMLHALEALSRQLGDSGRFAEAIEVAMTVVQEEPLRESAQLVLMEAHLAEGNVCEARRCLAHYRELVRRELGVDPSDSLVALVMTPRQRGPRALPPMLAVSS